VARKSGTYLSCISTLLLVTNRKYHQYVHVEATPQDPVRKDQTVLALVAITNWRLPQCVHQEKLLIKKSSALSLRNEMVWGSHLFVLAGVLFLRTFSFLQKTPQWIVLIAFLLRQLSLFYH
jgi:hypothetical protein